MTSQRDTCFTRIVRDGITHNRNTGLTQKIPNYPEDPPIQTEGFIYYNTTNKQFCFSVDKDTWDCVGGNCLCISEILGGEGIEVTSNTVNGETEFTITNTMPGTPGATGPQGATGATGPQGNDGATGPVGP